MSRIEGELFHGETRRTHDGRAYTIHYPRYNSRNGEWVMDKYMTEIEDPRTAFLVGEAITFVSMDCTPTNPGR